MDTTSSNSSDSDTPRHDRSERDSDQSSQHSDSPSKGHDSKSPSKGHDSLKSPSESDDHRSQPNPKTEQKHDKHNVSDINTSVETSESVNKKPTQGKPSHQDKAGQKEKPAPAKQPVRPTTAKTTTRTGNHVQPRPHTASTISSVSTTSHGKRPKTSPASQSSISSASFRCSTPRSKGRKRYGVFTSFEEVEKIYDRYPVRFRYRPVFTPRLTGYSHCWDAQRWDSTYYNEHRQKVAEARSMVNTRPPQTYMHLHLKLKKLQLEEERLATIERDNRILLEKMSYIMRTKGRVDNHKEYEYKSLNREKRQRELLNVTAENQEILKRIMARKPEYNHKTWERDWDQNQQYMDNIARFPKDWWLQQRDGQPVASQSRAGTSRSKQSARSPSRTSQTSKKSRRSEAQQQQEREDSPPQEK